MQSGQLTGGSRAAASSSAQSRPAQLGVCAAGEPFCVRTRRLQAFHSSSSRLDWMPAPDWQSQAELRLSAAPARPLAFGPVCNRRAHAQLGRQTPAPSGSTLASLWRSQLLAGSVGLHARLAAGRRRNTQSRACVCRARAGRPANLWGSSARANSNGS